ncbi:uncharacterized protein [Aegilops tauschii subsp. strangulata]|uniref:uncharacterized protein n=1 Tax=Aegilops tauschii subsp. strangulata TaxID=200361 RepID=UPI00098BB10C|nr:uncharacterized protein LOC109740074 [Aegilops tauschii subsp. strangulata]
MQVVLEDAERVEKHVLNFKGSIKGHRVLNCNRLASLVTRSAALRMLAYGTTADSWDEYLRMSERTCGDAMVKFATAVVEVFGPQYMREPTVADIERLLAITEARGWPGLFGSLDCMHWKWKNYPKALQGQYQGHVKKPTIILEAVVSHDLWI